MFWLMPNTLGPPTTVSTSRSRKGKDVQVGVFVGRRQHRLAADQHEVRLEQVADRESVLAGEMADAATEGQPADTRGRDVPARCGEAVLVRRPIDLASGATATD